MIANQLALVKREIWEHRSIWITPAAVAVVVTFIAIAAVIMVAAFGEAINPQIERIADATLPDAVRRAALAVFLLSNTTVFMFAMWFVMIFYCLDSLYAERKDRSILFWRSLPITDAETVVSKLLTAAIAIPIATMAGAIISHLLNLVIMSIWLSTEGVNPLRFIWGRRAAIRYVGCRAHIPDRDSRLDVAIAGLVAVHISLGKARSSP